jgi:signal transduction histidine kinase
MSAIEVDLRMLGDSLHLTVTDHGRGFDVRLAQHSGRLGLVGMRERAELLGGTFEIQSHPGDGTVIHASWPLIARDDVQVFFHES